MDRTHGWARPTLQRIIEGVGKWRSFARLSAAWVLQDAIQEGGLATAEKGEGRESGCQFNSGETRGVLFAFQESPSEE